jgi:hypothetical protein
MSRGTVSRGGGDVEEGGFESVKSVGGREAIADFKGGDFFAEERGRGGERDRLRPLGAVDAETECGGVVTVEEEEEVEVCEEVMVVSGVRESS